MSRVGRNDLCLCGSGKKYKKCCLSHYVVAPKNITNNKSDKILIKTVTNEFFQPMRLYYLVHDRDKLEGYFRELKCLKYDEHLSHWIIEYSEEASKIGLNLEPKQVPQEMQPLIIANIYIESETSMLVDVRSIERAKAIIQFISQYIPRNAAEVTHAAIYNQLTSVSKAEVQQGVDDLDYDDVFSQKNVFVVDSEKTVKELEEIAKKYHKEDDRLFAMAQKSEESSKRPLPKVEKFPVYFYEEGIDQFFMMCGMRQMIAMKHFLGEVNYTMYDFIQDSLNRGMG